MKALSIRQPWPYAIFHLGKDIENRDWPSAYTGSLLIHASKTWDRPGYLYLRKQGYDVPPIGYHANTMGAIVGKVNMVNCVKRSESPWFADTWGFVFEDLGDSILEEAKNVMLEIFEGMEHPSPVELTELESEIQRRLKRFFKKNIERNPLIIPTIIQI